MLAHEPEGPVVEVGGVGLLVRVSATTAASLPPTGGETVAPHGPGGARGVAGPLRLRDARGSGRCSRPSPASAAWGPRLALAICGLDAPDELRLALARGDSARLQAASGVGKRTAERVVLELRDRLGSLNGAGAPAPGGGADSYLSARDGLVALGFRPEEADAALAEAPAGLDAEGLVRHGLARLRRR